MSIFLSVCGGYWVQTCTDANYNFQKTDDNSCRSNTCPRFKKEKQQASKSRLSRLKGTSVSGFWISWISPLSSAVPRAQTVSLNTYSIGHACANPKDKLCTPNFTEFGQLLVIVRHFLTIYYPPGLELMLLTHISSSNPHRQATAVVSGHK